MQTYLERPRNLERSLMPANFDRLEGWTIDELVHEIERRLSSGQWQSRFSELPRSTVYKWEDVTGHRLERFCRQCGHRKKFEQMRPLPNHLTCVSCTPKAEREFEARERAAQRRNRFGHTHESLERDIATFLANGGNITVGPSPTDPRHPWTSEPLGSNKDSRRA